MEETAKKSGLKAVKEKERARYESLLREFGMK